MPALPSSEDRLFTSQEDWWNNACLNWCHDGWGLYAAGYKEAADLLVQHVEERQVGQDALVYPILFLYRQYLELEIKDLIRQARRLRDISGDFPKHHRIADLWEVCHQLLSEISPADSVEELKQISRLIGEFSEVDPTSRAFRYPEDKEGNPSLLGISHINLRNVRDVIGKIAVILMGASAQVGEFLSYKLEMEREAEQCLWSRLRGRRLEGVKFRRQQVLGPYVVDFLCLEPKLVIEVDGGQHAEQTSNDLQRTEYLKVLGYRVIRFWNHEVLGEPDAVLESIRAALVEIPSPPPSPGV